MVVFAFVLCIVLLFVLYEAESFQCRCGDFESRYFSEDVPFGTRVIQDYARRLGIETPVIDKVILKLPVL
jgi:hypothetical protein